MRSVYRVLPGSTAIWPNLVRQSGPWLIAALILAMAPASALAQGGDQIPADVLKKVKKSTVYLRVTLASGRVMEGSGFVAGGKVVVTNGHVLGMLSPEGRKPQKIQVVIDSGEPTEKTVLGQLLQVDPQSDLAAILVLDPALPPALQMTKAKDLLETQSLFVFGFPFGKQLGKNITVNKTSVSSLRKKPNGAIQDIQVNGGMHPGNSGGPVTNVNGQVVGVATAGMANAQIHFAIPAEDVHNFFLGRNTQSLVWLPYKEDGTIKVPLSFSMVDPLQRISKVKVDTWTGKIGPDRPPVSKIGVNPLPGDSPHQIYELTYKDHTAKGDIVLPNLAAGETLWMMMSFIRTDGSTTWHTSKPYKSTLQPVERKPVEIAYKHNPNLSFGVDLSSTTSLKLRALDGEEKTLLFEVKANMTEKSVGVPDLQGALLSAFSFNKIDVKFMLDKTDEAANDKVLQKGLQSAASLQLLMKVDKQGDIKPMKMAAPVDDKETKAVLAYMGIEVAQAMEAVTVPLPGQLVVYERPWKAQRKLLLGSEKASQPAIVNVTYTYLGVRGGPRPEALVILDGEIAGAQGEGLSVAGHLKGEALIDLTLNQVRRSEVTMNVDLDLPLGKSSLQANGTLRIILVRKAN